MTLQQKMRFLNSSLFFLKKNPHIYSTHLFQHFVLHRMVCAKKEGTSVEITTILCRWCKLKVLLTTQNKPAAIRKKPYDVLSVRLLYHQEFYSLFFLITVINFLNIVLHKKQNLQEVYFKKKKKSQLLGKRHINLKHIEINDKF